MSHGPVRRIMDQRQVLCPWRHLGINLPLAAYCDLSPWRVFCIEAHASGDSRHNLPQKSVTWFAGASFTSDLKKNNYVQIDLLAPEPLP